MDLETLFDRYFGTTDLTAVSEAMFEAGCDKLLVDFSLEEDSGRRFALWSLLHMLGIAPDPATAFEDLSERDAAWRFIDLCRRGEDQA